MTSLPIFPFF